MSGTDNTVKIIERDGKRYVNPLGDERYLVRHHDMPDNSHLSAYLDLLESFERRFLHAAEEGLEWITPYSRKDMNVYIAEKRKEYEACDDAKKPLLANQLCVAYLERGIATAKMHIQKRIDDDAVDGKKLLKLQEYVESDLMAALPLLKYVRRKGGRPDADDVLDEMKGEPYKIFVGTLDGNQRVLEQFNTNREYKAAQAMKCMDKVADAVVQLAKAYPEYVAAGLPEQIEELRRWTKERVQLHVSDPDFTNAHDNMIIARNAIFDYERASDAGAPSKLPADYRGKGARATEGSVHLLKKSAELLYDMAHIRGARDVSADAFVKRVQECMPKSGRSREGSNTHREDI